MRFFTICAKNYLANAVVLGERLAEIHPDHSFRIFLADRPIGFDPGAVPFPITTFEQVGLIDPVGMIKRYNITELSTAIKPYCFSYLFSESDDPVVYLDPDIYPVSALTEVESSLETFDSILTPHILRPSEGGGFPTENFLRLGIYNLGFLALRRSPDTERFLTWWAEKLETDCLIDIPRGIFVDQKWADMLPAFVERTLILRHPGYNVAYWNLQNRKITTDGSVHYSNGEPLRFVHFSGLPKEPSDLISKRSEEFSITNSPALGELLSDYRGHLRASNEDFYGSLPFSFFLSPTGDTNLHTPELESVSTQLLRSPATYLETTMLRSIEDYDAHQVRSASELERQRILEESLVSGDEPIAISAFDVVANCTQPLFTDFLYAYEISASGKLMPNWREHLAAEGHGFCNRIRAFVHLLDQEFQPPLDARVYITEQATALFAELSNRFPSLVGSEFLGDSVELGGFQDGFRNENVEDLTFKDGSFDYVLSLDVFEHVADYQSALREVLRCLSPGGTFVFSIPTNGFNKHDHQIRAAVIDGEVVHYTEPEYHGNPVDPDGALCYRYYGWELLDELQSIGFVNALALLYWSEEFGYFGRDQMVFSAQKPLR